MAVSEREISATTLPDLNKAWTASKMRGFHQNKEKLEILFHLTIRSGSNHGNSFLQFVYNLVSLVFQCNSEPEVSHDIIRHLIAFIGKLIHSEVKLMNSERESIIEEKKTCEIFPKVEMQRNREEKMEERGTRLSRVMCALTILCFHPSHLTPPILSRDARASHSLSSLLHHSLFLSCSPLSPSSSSPLSSSPPPSPLSPSSTSPEDSLSASSPLQRPTRFGIFLSSFLFLCVIDLLRSHALQYPILDLSLPLFLFFSLMSSLRLLHSFPECMSAFLQEIVEDLSSLPLISLPVNTQGGMNL